MSDRPRLRFCIAAFAFALAAASAIATHAIAQTASPPPESNSDRSDDSIRAESAPDGLILRTESWEPTPPAKPTLADTFASGCAPAHPELAFAALPRALREVPLEEMIGQLLVVSYTGTKPDDPGVRQAQKALAEGRIGGVLTFRYNIASAADISAVNATFNAAHPSLRALVGVDQEGGLVTRVKPSEGAPVTPSASEVAATSPESALAVYSAMAKNLADLGFNANFGPVVDLAVNPDNPVIAKFGRSYGASPRTVAAYAGAFVDAHRAAGISTALKHFPGHGSSTDDSHEGTIDLSPTWRRSEMVPFRDLIRAGEADMVMVGHLTLAGLTGEDGLPASLSPDAIDGFLRKTLCYEGVVVSDDLAMDAVSARWDTADAVRLMLDAGGDIALLSLPAGKGYEVVDDVIARLAAAARDSHAVADRIRHAYARVAQHKLDLAERRSLSFTASATGALTR